MTNNLMTSKRFAPLFWTQFLSAFNDNLVKNTLIFLILFKLAAEEAASMVTIASAVLILPFLLFSAIGGEIADKFDKGKVAERLKLIEIGAAIVAVIGIGFSSIWLLMVALFLFGFVSALFGPVKYGILPDHIEASELPKANAWVEAGTFLAILLGTIVAGFTFREDASIWIFGPMMMGFSIICWIFSRYIPQTGAAEPELRIDTNIFRSTGRLLSELWAQNKILHVSWMVSWFWLIGAIVMSLMPTMVKQLLGGHELAVTAYLAIFAVSIGLGSAFSAWLSAGRIVLLPAPIGTALIAMLLGVLSIILWNLAPLPPVNSVSDFFASGPTVEIGFILGGLAIAGALIVVPTFAAVQMWAPEKNRARVVAAVNVLNALFIVVGIGIVAALQAFGATIPELLLGLAVINIIVAGLMLKYQPTNPLRDLISIILRSFHRMEIIGLENVEKAGPAPIIALNHVSYLDGGLALSLTEQEPVFAVDHKVSQKWWAKPFLKLCNFMPLDPSKPMATRTLINAVEDGNPLVIFPEGRITVTGGLMKVYDGAAMVADKTNSMILPVRIEGLERSLFSKLSVREIRKALFPKVKVTILEPTRLEIPERLKGKERRTAAGAALYQLMSDLVFQTTPIEQTVPEKLILAAKKVGLRKLALQDPTSGNMSYGTLLTGASVIGRRLSKMLPGEKHIGVMLPNANGAAVTIFGLMSAAKIPAMINFTAGARNILSACNAAEVKTIVSSRLFIKHAKLEDLVAEIEPYVDIIWLDEVRKEISIFEKLVGFLTRTKIITKSEVNDPAAILFTSGSEGVPKGVVLTHRNMLTNVAQAAARIDFNPSDKLFNVLPVFHSFGLTAGTVLPLVSGVPVYMYPSPLHYRIVPELVYSSNATIMFGTDTFLSGYARTANSYDFRSLRYCFSGAEPVRASTQKTYMEKFGVRILEGYGVTETAPVIALNTPMHNSQGSVGRLLPGIEYKLEKVPGIDQGGRLFIKGGNVMAGYLLHDKPGQLQPLPDGWHDTGDIVTMDDIGFVTIKGRAKRFAKIAGEMVSLAAIEKLAGEVWPEHLNVVVSVPDAKKGERIILITEFEGADRKAFMEYARSQNAMDLMIPAEIKIDSVPLLGSGKIDFVAAQKLGLNEPA
ncbi:acyl-[ACP]--phospholipid O-acyltransferase [Lentilitoribacter sp. Alg239-R112]|uniref:acyl-[ACP]--phospholipid O-acyltransferase n=1 Tax=Lentilitoribacter sp. Alg239-R112 TaxID=2305987 RepID=UPI0013A6E8E9|nr:acyl-[ACP]--phospholipid O-acyltransferase [Lentilitoribacter sp. Alg239-R112]